VGKHPASNGPPPGFREGDVKGGGKLPRGFHQAPGVEVDGPRCRPPRAVQESGRTASPLVNRGWRNPAGSGSSSASRWPVGSSPSVPGAPALSPPALRRVRMPPKELQPRSRAGEASRRSGGSPSSWRSRAPAQEPGRDQGSSRPARRLGTQGQLPTVITRAGPG